MSEGNGTSDAAAAPLAAGNLRRSKPVVQMIQVAPLETILSTSAAVSTTSPVCGASVDTWTCCNMLSTSLLVSGAPGGGIDATALQLAGPITPANPLKPLLSGHPLTCLAFEAGTIVLDPTISLVCEAN